MSVKLVVIGDSLSQGFQSGSLTKAHLAYPNIVADALAVDDFRFPLIGDEGSWRINLEEMCRSLESAPGKRFATFKSLQAIMKLRKSGKFRPDSPMPSLATQPLFHNLSISGFELGDSDILTDKICRQAIAATQGRMLTRNESRRLGMYASARPILNPNNSAENEDLTQIDKAARLAQQEGGIDYLFCWLGANNCLGTAFRMTIIWSEQADLARLNHQRICSLWRPEHFRFLLNRVADKIDTIKAKHVLVATIPHVTVIPMCRGITPGATPQDELNSEGYHEFYTHFWIKESEFAKSPRKHPYFRWQQAREIDQTIDAYNAALKEQAAARGWHVVDICRAFDMAAYRGRGVEPTYQFPIAFINAFKRNPATSDRFHITGRPILDTRYPKIDPIQPYPADKYEGGLISLDGMHPSSICHAFIAHEFLEVIQQVNPHERITPIDWDQMISADSLLVDAPIHLKSMIDVMGGLAQLAKLQGFFVSAFNLLNTIKPRKETSDLRL